MKMTLLFLSLTLYSCTNNAPPSPQISSVPQTVQPQQLPANHPNISEKMEENSKHPPILQAAPDIVPPKKGEIKATKFGTIADVYKNRLTLKEKQIQITAKVMKFTPMILNKNWIHLQDGSGSREESNYDLTITSTQNFEIGKVVTVECLVKTDVSLGMGYNYTVLLENCVIK